MGIIQCGTVKDKNEILNIIEKSINNKKTTLDKKIFEEYYMLKHLLKPRTKQEKTNSKEKENDNFPIITKKNNFISVKKRMNRFIKWYFMSHPNQQPNVRGKRNSNSETKISSNKEFNPNYISNINNNIFNNNNDKANIRKNQSQSNLTNIKNQNLNLSPITAMDNNNSNNTNSNSNINKINRDLNGNFLKTSNQNFFNNTIRLSNLNLNINNYNNVISPIVNNKTQFNLENEGAANANQNFNLNINKNLNNKLNNISVGKSNCNSNNKNDSSNKEALNNQNKNFKNDDEIFNNNQSTKLPSNPTIPKLSLNRNLSSNNNISETNAKIKLIKTDASVKVIPKQDHLENINNYSNNYNYKDNLNLTNSNNYNNNNNNYNMNSNIENSDNSSTRNLEQKRTSSTNANSNSNNIYLNNQIISSNIKHNNNINNNNNNNNSNSIENQSSSSNTDKSTTARILLNTNNYNNNNHTNNTKNSNNSNNPTSKNHACSGVKDSADSNSNSQGCSEAQAEKTKVFNNLYSQYNSSQENNNDPQQHSNSILEQQLKIFDDSNIIESNLRLSYRLDKEKFLKRVAKGPPASFRWVSWLITSNAPFERAKDFYAFLLTQQLAAETDIQIKKDLNRTLSGIKISNFIIDDTQLVLYNVLKAFALVDNEVSYCQGMNFIVGYLLVISDFNELETFYFMLALFSHSFTDNLGIRGFFLEGFPLLNLYVSLFLSLFGKNLPELKKHFETLEIPDEVWISKWFRTLFTLSLPFELCMRIWDCLVIYGLDFLLSFTLAFMKYLEPELLKKQDLFEVIEFFKKMSPFFAMENEGDDALIAESVRFIEAFNIEEIILNAKKIKILPSLVKEQMEMYQKMHKISFEKFKVKYNFGYDKNESSSLNLNYYCDSNFNAEENEGGRVSSFLNNHDHNQNQLNNFSNYNNNINNDDCEISLYSMQGERPRNCDFDINTETCRSEIEKIKNNLEPKKSNMYASNILNLNSSNNNILGVYTEKKVQIMKNSESNKQIESSYNKNVIENQINKNSNSNNKSKNNYNCSADIEHSPTNSDTDLNADDIQDKITSYTFKAKSNINGNLKRFEFDKDNTKTN